MLILPEKTTPSQDHGKAAEAQASMAEQPPFDPPPTYASSSSPPPTMTPELPGPVALKSKPTNYLSLNRENNPIKGTYTIDPFMSIPQSLLPALESETVRKNLKVYAKNGSVDVDITLLVNAEKLSIDDADRRNRATLDVGSHNGSVNVKLRRINTPTSRVPIPFHLNVSSHNGAVTIGMPSTFEGLLTIHAKNGSVKLSDEITRRIAMHNEEKHTQRCFVGDISSFNDSDGDWPGDKLDVDAYNGRVKVFFVDEADSEASKRGGLFSRIFG